MLIESEGVVHVHDKVVHLGRNGVTSGVITKIVVTSKPAWNASARDHSGIEDSYRIYVRGDDGGGYGRLHIYRNPRLLLPVAVQPVALAPWEQELLNGPISGHAATAPKNITVVVDRDDDEWLATDTPNLFRISWSDDWFETYDEIARTYGIKEEY